MSAFRIFRRLSELLDVNISSPADADRLVYNATSGKWENSSVAQNAVAPHHASHESGGNDQVSVTVDMIDAEASTSGQVPTSDGAGGVTWEDQSGSGGSVDAADVTFTPAGTIAATDTQAAVEEVATDAAAALSTHEADTTSVHGIADTSALLDTSDIGVTVQAHDADLDTYAGITPSANVQSVLGAADFAAIRTLLGLVIGTDVQAFDTDLSTWAGLTPSANAQSLVTAANYAAMRGLLDLEAGTDFPSLATFDDHSARHENGGADEISVAGLSGQLADSQPTDATLVDSGAATDGQVLTADGAGGASWEDATGGTGSVDVEDMNLIVAMEVFA